MTKKELNRYSNYDLYLKKEVNLLNAPYNFLMFKGYSNVTAYVDKKCWLDMEIFRPDEYRQALYDARYRNIKIVVVEEE